LKMHNENIKNFVWSVRLKKRLLQHGFYNLGYTFYKQEN
jgi:hypothetical protein